MPPGAARPFDPKAVDELYRQHGHVVLRRARCLLHEEQEAQEILQEVFVSLLARPEQFGQRSNFTTWLYAVTTNACLTRMRNHRTRQRLLDERASSIAPGPMAGDAERRALLRQLLARLPERLATVAVHYFLDEMTQQEIAEQLGCSRSQVSNLVNEVETYARAESEGRGVVA